MEPLRGACPVPRQLLPLAWTPVGRVEMMRIATGTAKAWRSLAAAAAAVHHHAYALQAGHHTVTARGTHCAVCCTSHGVHDASSRTQLAVLTQQRWRRRRRRGKARVVQAPVQAAPAHVSCPTVFEGYGSCGSSSSSSGQGAGRHGAFHLALRGTARTRHGCGLE